jgi:hypothetical protein
MGSMGFTLAKRTTPMRMLRRALAIAASAWLMVSAVAAIEARAADPDLTDDEGAASEPADPDDARDIAADNNANDVGQDALPPGDDSSGGGDAPGQAQQPDDE